MVKLAQLLNPSQFNHCNAIVTRVMHACNHGEVSPVIKSIQKFNQCNTRVMQACIHSEVNPVIKSITIQSVKEVGHTFVVMV